MGLFDVFFLDSTGVLSTSNTEPLVAEDSNDGSAGEHDENARPDEMGADMDIENDTPDTTIKRGDNNAGKKQKKGLVMRDQINALNSSDNVTLTSKRRANDTAENSYGANTMYVHYLFHINFSLTFD